MREDSTGRADSDAVLGWLLEGDQPSARYLALRELLGRPEGDGEVLSAKGLITKRGWASDILSRQNPEGWWVSSESLYQPKYLSTNWMLLILSDLGLTKEDGRIASACELWIKRFSKPDGGFGADGMKGSHLCIVGNTTRALIKFGYSSHPRVRSALDWMVKNQAVLGGWSCFGSGRNLDSWEPMSAFAAYPRQSWTRSMKLAVEKGAEFFLERELHKQGGHYEPWYRFHYPVHYYYDLLVGLEFMADLGYSGDRRLGHAVSALRRKRRRDGRWNLGKVHPDVEGGMADWYREHPGRAPTPFALESPGKPSKIVTLRAMRVLAKVEERI